MKFAYKKYVLILVFIVSGSNSTIPADVPSVDITLGRILGSHKLSYDGRIFSSFEGIPYAKPPIGPLRFEEPKPMDPWIGSWNASFLVECIQAKFATKNYNMSGQEDCLYINVYVPRIEPDPGEKLDVLVHIHGGVFLFGSGHFYAHPEFIMDRDVIYITFNYRIGIFGLLCTDNDALPSNVGFKDQIFALRWIQENIASFGGNPNSVTVFGMSAGAISLHLLYLSPMAQGLFQRGFIQSGTALSHSAIEERPLEKFRSLADAISCPLDQNNRILVDCLKQRPLQQLWSKMPIFFADFYYRNIPGCPLSACIEAAPETFLPDNPYHLLAQGKVLDVPLIISINSGEDAGYSTTLDDEMYNDIDEQWEKVAPYLLEYNETLDRELWEITARKIKQFYFGDKPINRENSQIYGQMRSQRTFYENLDLAAKLQANATKSPVYFLYLGYPGEHKSTLAHAEDGQFYFYGRYYNDPTPNELKMKDILIDMLVSYAQTGIPKVPGVDWEPTKGDDELTYLNISSPDLGTIKLQKARGALWNREFWTSLGFNEGVNYKKPV